MGKRLAKHGGWQTPEYKVWQSMLARCRNPNLKVWPLYGGRGIRVCERWHDFAAFIEDMGWRPGANHSLERIDNDGHYEPGNVRWATTAEQQRNKRTNRFIEYQGERLTREDWAARFNLDPTTLRYRLAQGWPIEKALTEPPRPERKPRLIVYQGETLSLTQWAKRLGCNHRTLGRRLDRGWPVERILTNPQDE
jgi:hypothetical protein